MSLPLSIGRMLAAGSCRSYSGGCSVARQISRPLGSRAMPDGGADAAPFFAENPHFSPDRFLSAQLLSVPCGPGQRGDDTATHAGQHQKELLHIIISRVVAAFEPPGQCGQHAQDQGAAH